MKSLCRDLNTKSLDWGRLYHTTCMFRDCKPFLQCHPQRSNNVIIYKSKYLCVIMGNRDLPAYYD